MPPRTNYTNRLLVPLALMLVPVTLFAAPASPVRAQPAADASVTSASETVAAARRIIAARYVLPETASRLDAALAAAERAGRFKGLKGEALALRINEVMRTVTADAHLSVSFDPTLAARLAAGRQAGGDGPPPDMVRDTVLANGGVARLEVLPGNVRYLDYRGFYWETPEAEAALANAMAFLRGGDAIIIDIRRNGGGSPGAVAAMAGYFLKAGTPLARFEMRGQPGETNEAAPAPFSLAGKPVYVLAGKGSFSAAEEFAAHVSAFGFAQLVGTNTGGGAFRNEFEVLPGGFLLSVSIGRPVHAVTGKDWEGVGVAPAIATSEAAALDVAQAEAIRAVLARAPAGERASLERLAAYYVAKAEGRAASRPLESYEGAFGNRTFSVAESKLLVARDGRPPVALQPLGPDLFATAGNPAQQWRFEWAGTAVSAVTVDDGRGDGLRLEKATR